LGQQPLDIGSSLGARMSTAGANSGQSLLLGGLGAAKTMQAGHYNPMTAALMGLGSNPAFGQGVAGMFSGGAPTPLADSEYPNAFQMSGPSNYYGANRPLGQVGGPRY
jgi:hypothetical protein